MATYYVRSTDGNNADSGATWALAKADLHTPTWAAGDIIYVSQAHAQSTGSAITIATAGTLASPTRIVGANDAAEPPTAVSTTGAVTTTGAFGITISGAAAYVYGLVFNVGTGASLANFSYETAGELLLENCVINLVTTATGSRVLIGNGLTARAHLRLRNTDITFGNTSNSLIIEGGSLIWEGGGVKSGSAITTLFKAASTLNRGSSALLSGVDLTGCGTSLAIFTGGGTAPFDGVIRDCRLPASWSGTLTTGTIWPGQRFEMYNCDSGDTNYRLWVEDNAGSTKQETTIVRSGGASDGTTPLSWKMVTSANAEYPLIHHRSPEIVIWNETVGSSVTATVEIVHDSQGAGSGSKFQDDEIWLDVMYLGTSGAPLGAWKTDCKADVLATAANQTDSTETWTTTGLASPVKQKLSVSFTPQEKGFIHARVVMAKASKTCYVCPKIAVT